MVSFFDDYCPPKKRVPFVEHPYKYEDYFEFYGDPPEVTVNTGLCVSDFNSLYPSEMIMGNVCLTTVVYNPKFKIELENGDLVSPFDRRFINIVCTPLKIDKFFFNVLCFIIKPEVQQSVVSLLLTDLIRMRKMCKKEMNKNANNYLYDYYNNLQLSIKRVSNSSYGIFNDKYKPIFRTLIGSLITRAARQSLVRFYLNCLHFYKINRIKMQARKICYGDTDSLFKKMSKHECLAILEKFAQIPCNRNVLKLELEKVARNALFLAKKSYILFHDGGKVTAKQIFTKSKSTPSKVLLVKFIDFVLNKILVTDTATSNEIGSFLFQLLSEFNNSPDASFIKASTMKLNLDEYKNNSQAINQLKHISKLEKINYYKGTKIYYTYYNFIFKEGEMYGPVHTKSQLDFLSKKSSRSSTLLTCDMLKYFQDYFSIGNIKIFKEHILDLDTYVVVCKTFECINQMNASIANEFRNLYVHHKQNVFKSHALFGKMVAEVTLPPVVRKRRAKEQEESDSKFICKDVFKKFIVKIENKIIKK